MYPNKQNLLKKRRQRKHTNIIKEIFHNLEYPLNLIEETISKTANIPCNKLLQYKQNKDEECRIPHVLAFNPQLKHLLKIIKNIKCKEIFLIRNSKI